MQQSQRHCLFYSTHSSSLSKPCTYITHNVTQLLTIWPEIQVCDASHGYGGLVAHVFLTPHPKFFFHFQACCLQPQPTLTQLTSLDVTWHHLKLSLYSHKRLDTASLTYAVVVLLSCEFVFSTFFLLQDLWAAQRLKCLSLIRDLLMQNCDTACSRTFFTALLTLLCFIPHTAISFFVLPWQSQKTWGQCSWCQWQLHFVLQW